MPDGSLMPRTLRALSIGMRWFDGASGGLDRVFAHLTHALPDYGVRSQGLVLGPPDAAARSGGAVHAFGGRILPERLWHARRAIGALTRGGQFDLVVSHFALFTLPALDHVRGLPLVVHFHGPWADESAAEGQGGLAVALKHSMESSVYRRAERMIVLSRAFADLAISRYGVAPDRLRIVPGSVDLPRFARVPCRRADAREALGWPRERRVLLAVRRLVRRMGLSDLIAAMPAVRRADPDVLLMIAGRGPQELELRAQVQALGLEQHVHFLGFLPEDDLPTAYRAAELNLVPTKTLEGFGLTAAEALAAGTPSIVAPVGGLPEVVGPLSPDLVFAGTAPGVMAEHIIAALRGGLAIPDAVACQAHAARHFSGAMSALRTAAIYREAA